MNWDSHGTSHVVLNELLARLTVRTQDAESVSDDQMQALFHRWNTALAARLDNAIEFAGAQPWSVAVASARVQLAEEYRVLRQTLDKGSGRQTLKAAEERELCMLALSAGLAQLGDSRSEMVRVGRILLD